MEATRKRNGTTELLVVQNISKNPHYYENDPKKLFPIGHFFRIFGGIFCGGNRGSDINYHPPPPCRYDWQCEADTNGGLQ
jgi:hypothetical protein